MPAEVTGSSCDSVCVPDVSAEPAPAVAVGVAPAPTSDSDNFRLTASLLKRRFASTANETNLAFPNANIENVTERSR